MSELARVFSREPQDERVAVVDGYGCAVLVDRGQLVLRDGMNDVRRERRFSRTSKLARVVVVGHSGHVTIDALAWCEQVGASLVVLDPGGRVLSTTGVLRRDDPRLRRAQGLAAGTEVGLDIARSLVGAKLTEAADVAERHLSAELAKQMLAAGWEAEAAVDYTELRRVEASAGMAYWRGWQGRTLIFAGRSHVPVGWAAGFTGRRPRPARTPLNAMLNYCYALAEAEARLACAVLGLDPGLGFLHTDRQRSSLALDIVEPVRPVVDAWVLQLAAERTFRAVDFHESAGGICRVLPPLTHALAERMRSWGAVVAPWAEAVANTVGDLAGAAPSSALTGAHRTEAARLAGRRHAPGSARLGNVGGPAAVRRKDAVPALQPGCAGCGVELSGRGRYCAECLTGARTANASAWVAAGTAAARRRSAGQAPRPQHAPEAMRLRAERIAVHLAADRAWNADHVGAERRPRWFQAEVLPHLRQTPVAVIAAATGLSAGHCSRIRTGRSVPHPRHWPALAALGAGSSPV